MSEHLRAVVVGAGWAGEGHTKALQWCGVEVAAICARQPDVVRAVADRLGVAEASTDWRESIERLRPDIVTIATPGVLRLPVVEVAAALGCHLLCEKPLAVDAATAERVYRLAEEAGVKHAYAATHRYDPSVAWLAELVRDGAIGALRQIVGTARLNLPLPLYTWAVDAREGGGPLNNVFSHELAMLSATVGGKPVRATGAADMDHLEVPVDPNLHDFRAWLAAGAEFMPERAAGLERRSADLDSGHVALLEFAGPHGAIPACIAAGPGLAVPGDVDGWRLYGEAGSLRAERETLFSFRIARAQNGEGAAEPLPVPQRLRDDLPCVGDDVQNKWCALARDFVADIRGEAHRPYLTFRDGWRTQEAIDAIRGGCGWAALPA